MNQVQSISFYNQKITVISHDNKPYVVMKSIVENIGLDWVSQYKRVNRHKVLRQGVVMMTIPSKGGKQESICLPLGYLNGWLLGIDSSRVKPELREPLERYQLECFDVLYNHFMPKLAQQHPNTINSEQQYQIKEAVMQLARKTGKKHATIYRDLYNHFKIPRYQDLLVKDFQAALKFLQWSEPKQIQNSNTLFIPFSLACDGTYQVLVKNGKARKRSVHYAENARDIGTLWGSPE